MTAPLNLDGFLPLIRPRIVFLVGVSAAAGMFLVQPASLAPLPWLLAGTMLVAAAGCALNHLLEREADASMERTQNRPLVTGSMTVGQVKGVGLSGLVVGLSLLAFGCSWVVAAIELGAAVIYLGLYTPLKSRTTSNTWVGAISGA
ncbi:MAG: UbiA family prenyltransferase, partial [Planctomycetota bacterium]|nr:UbiA family prenyltransferase [Planctomycetota bacterium]